MEEQRNQLLNVKSLSLSFDKNGQRLFAVKDLSFALGENETLSIVGESGSGKTLTCLSILRLLPPFKNPKIEGQIDWKGRNLNHLSDRELLSLRGKEIAIVFQEPMTSLNPVFTVGDQIREQLLIHFPNMSKKEARDRAIECLKEVKIPDPVARFDQYPHEFSGGMRQRVMIAMALSCRPKLLIADEPTTALDVTVESQILDLLQEIREKNQMSMIFITHDLGVVSKISDRVLLMYAGEEVEQSSSAEFFEKPRHPYGRALLESVPNFTSDRMQPLRTISGVTPSLDQIPTGCSFRSRCEFSTDECLDHPRIESIDRAQVRCWRWKELS